MTYYLIQAILITVWWAAMASDPHIYAAFAYTGLPRHLFDVFILPDIGVIACLSLVTWRRPTPILKAVMTGAFAYAAAWCVAATWTTRSGYLGTTLMILGLSANIFALTGERCFYRKPGASTVSRAVNTALQSAIIWCVFLFFIPTLILSSFEQWPPSTNHHLFYPGIVLFTASSILGVLSARALVVAGKGTPLPLNAPQLLVTIGPYQYVRNPMAVAGLGQGLAVAMISNSVEVAVYGGLGMLVWNYLVRPVEEQDLERTFGESYKAYTARVRCWIPSGRRT